MNFNFSTLFDVALSLVFVFFTLSLFVSGIVEFINALIEQRSRLLQLALLKILERPDIANDYRRIIRAVKRGEQTAAPAFARLWNHPLVRVKRQRYLGFDKPISYLSANSFSSVILDLLAPATGNSLPGNATEQTMKRIRRVVSNPDTDPDLATLKAIVGPLLAKSDTLADFRKNLETWYDSYMEQVSGWFKRYAQGVVWVVSIVISLLFNIDTIHITRRIFTDKTLRDNLVAQAERTAQTKTKEGLFVLDSTQLAKPSQLKRIPKDPDFLTYLKERNAGWADSLETKGKLTAIDSLRIQDIYLQYIHDSIDELGLPIGWIFVPKASFLQKTGYFFQLLFSWVGCGWILTATALSFGAPFWFDLLLKIVNIRNVTRKPPSSVVPT